MLVSCFFSMRIEVGQHPYSHPHYALWVISDDRNHICDFDIPEKSLFFCKKIEISLGHPLYRLHLPLLPYPFKISYYHPKSNTFPKKSYTYYSLIKPGTCDRDIPIINPSAHIYYWQMDKTTHKTLCWSHMTISYLLYRPR